ncbi:hypothetical protein B484DRAFT_407983 [Ochromonadaceae sp. CCMP2298]|nr:hypothetical protein B484DRAFT_407983 [Ochromonadaceae sp. CCMP2298]
MILYPPRPPPAVQAAQTSGELVGSAWCADSISRLLPTLRREMHLPAGVPGGQAEYRMSLAPSSLSNLPPAPAFDPQELSGAFNFLCEDKPYSRYG